jgi:hypothetical protein
MKRSRLRESPRRFSNRMLVRKSLQQVVTAIGPALDASVQANFPGAGVVSDVEKAGLVNAVVAIVNKVQCVPAATASN